MKPVLLPTPTTTTSSFHQQQRQHLLSSSPFLFSSRKKRLRPPKRGQISMTIYASATTAITSNTISSTIHRHHRSSKKDKIVVIMGATGTGKSRLSIDLATRFYPSEIVNSDKMQVYKGLDITTNKIPTHDRRGVRHHFLGDFDEHADLSPSDFRWLGEPTISDILTRKRIPFLVGGSNSFVYSLLVQQYDPESDVFDPSIGADSVSPELRYDCCFLWVDSSLPVLYEYLDKRVDDMLNSGMFEELAKFFNKVELERNYEKRVGLRKAIGVPEFQRYFKKYPPGKQSNYEDSNKGWWDWDGVRRGAYEESVREIKENTRQLAKRQIEKIKKLKRAGWDLHRLDATAAFRLLLMESDPEEWRRVWEMQVLEPSMKIVNRFLEE